MYLNVLSSNVPKEYVGVLLLYAALIVLFSQMYRLYGTPRDRSKPQEIVLVAKALSWSTAMLMADHLFVRRENDFPASDPCERCYEHRRSRLLEDVEAGIIVQRRVAAGIGVRNVLIVGAGKIGRELGEYFDTNRHLGVVVKGFLDHNRFGDPRVLGRIENLPEVCRAHFVDEIIITMTIYATACEGGPVFRRG